MKNEMLTDDDDDDHFEDNQRGCEIHDEMNSHQLTNVSSQSVDESQTESRADGEMINHQLSTATDNDSQESFDKSQTEDELVVDGQNDVSNFDIELGNETNEEDVDEIKDSFQILGDKGFPKPIAADVYALIKRENDPFSGNIPYRESVSSYVMYRSFNLFKCQTVDFLLKTQYTILFIFSEIWTRV
jgi:hypothetical protein